MSGLAWLSCLRPRGAELAFEAVCRARSKDRANAEHCDAERKEMDGSMARSRFTFLSSLVLTMLVAATLPGATASLAAADDVADFYRGKRINFVVGYGSGGGYDIYARLFARFIGEHIPGNPTVVPQNMPAPAAVARRTGSTPSPPRMAPQSRVSARRRRPTRRSASQAFSSTHANSIGSAIWRWSTTSCS